MNLSFSFRDSCVVLADEGPTTVGRNGANLLFIHGRYGGAGIWRPLVERLIPERRSVVVSLPGFGLSFSSTERGMLLEEYVELVNHLIELLSRQGQEYWVVVGHDIGGAIALLSSLNPSRIYGTVLSSCASILRPPSGFNCGWAAWRSRRMMKKLMQESTRFGSLDNRAQTDLMRDNWTSSVTSENIQAMHALEFSWPKAYARAHLKSALNSFKVPVLMLGGREDTFCPASVTEELAAVTHDADCFIHPEAGHWPTLEKPDWAYEKISDFLFRIEGEWSALKRDQKSLSR